MSVAELDQFLPTAIGSRLNIFIPRKVGSNVLQYLELKLELLASKTRTKTGIGIRGGAQLFFSPKSRRISSSNKETQLFLLLD